MPTLFNRSPRDPRSVNAPNLKKSAFGFRRTSADESTTKGGDGATRKRTRPLKGMRPAKSPRSIQESDNLGQQIYCSPTSSDGFVHLRVSLAPPTQPAAATSTFEPPAALAAGGTGTGRAERGGNGIIPTLASAIHLDPSLSSSSGNYPAPLFASSTFGATATSALRSSEPPSTFLPPSSQVPTPLALPPSSSGDTLPSNNSDRSIAEIPRPPSRAESFRRNAVKAVGKKLSIDGLLHHVVRRRSSQAAVDGLTTKKLDIRRWSSTAAAPSVTGPVPVEQQAEKRSSMALPGIRTLRNKFSVRASLVPSPTPAASLAGVGPGTVRREGMKAALGLGFPPISRLSPRLSLSDSRRRSSDLPGVWSSECNTLGKGPVGMAGVLRKVVNAPPETPGLENDKRRSISVQARYDSFVHPSTTAFVPRLIPFDPPSPPVQPPLSTSTSLEAHSRTPLVPGPAALAPTQMDNRFASPALDDASPLDPSQPRSELSAAPSTSLAPSNSDMGALTTLNSSLTVSSGETGVNQNSQQGIAELRTAMRRMRELTNGTSVSSLVGVARPPGEGEEEPVSRSSSHAETLARLSASHSSTLHLAAGFPDRPSAGSLHSAGRHSIDGLPMAKGKGVAFPTTMRPSRSKSTTALPALLSAFDLVESTQRTQGNGWWSRMPPPPPRSSHITPTLHMGPTAPDGEVLESRLAELEKLASRSAIAPRRAHGPLTPASARSAMTPPRRPLTPLKMEQRTPWRAGSGLPRSRSRSFVAPLPHPVFDSPRKSHLRSHFSTTPETPCRSRLPTSNDRRVSWNVTHQPPPGRVVRPGTPKSRLVSPEAIENELRPAAISSAWEQKVQELKAKHALETDALLFALSGAKVGEDKLRKEVEGLHRLLAEGLAEREALRGRVSKLEHRLSRDGAGSAHRLSRRGESAERSGKKAIGLAINGADELLAPMTNM